MFDKHENEEKKNTKEYRQKLLKRMIKEFESQYKSEKDCQEKINKMLYPEGNYFCRECNSSNVEKEYGERNIKCLNCKKITSLTTDTFFHKIHSARAYLAPIWMMERGIILNASEIGKISQVVNSTGQHILKKIAYVVMNEMEERMPLVTSEQMIHTICKRSKETRRRQHPQSEIYDAKQDKFASRPELGNSKPALDLKKVELKFDQRVDKKHEHSVLDQVEEAILKVMSDIPLQLEVLQKKINVPTSNLLPALTMLELNGVIERLPGELFKKIGFSQKNNSRQFNERLEIWGDQTAEPDLSRVQTDSNIELQKGPGKSTASEKKSGLIPKFKLEKTIRLIKERFHGISRKYLQYYLSIVWVFVDRMKWIDDALLAVCCRAPDIKAFSLYSYVSPYDVKIVIVR